MKVTLYNDFHTPVEDKDFLAVLQTIKSNHFEEKIKSIRYAYHKGLESLGDKLKKELPAFTPSATFTKGRKLEFLNQYSGIAHLDFDDISATEIQEVRNKVDMCGITFASFISPSGTGIKIFVRIKSGVSEHQQMIIQLMHYYQELTGYQPDAKCKDITRLCFVSWDENAYLNANSEYFCPEVADPQMMPHGINFSTQSVDYCVQFTEKVSTYQKGNRNSHIYLLARNANRLGIEKEEILQHCLNSFDLDTREVKAAVESAFNNNQIEFAKFANVATVAKEKVEEFKEFDWSKDLLFNTPKIPLSVHESLPKILKEGSAAFDIHREKDVFLTSALVILSGCLPGVQGLYGQRTVYPNLFCFILAPPASGKGSMQSSKELADVYHNKVLDESKELKVLYERELRDYKRKTSILNAKSNSQTDIDPPVEPPFKVVYIPANTSTAKLYLHLQHNDEQGIICETEADTLGAVFKNEWGSYSDLLRKGFHHEKVSLSRKSNSEFVDINHPRISVALTGTPNQIFNIIPNAEDGLFSRFIFYAFRSDANWVSPAPDPFRVNLTDHFKELGERVYQMVLFLENNPTHVNLTSNQWSRLNREFKDYLKDITEFAGEEATSVIKRMGLILYRICMIFTAIRKFENGECAQEIYCSDDDFENAIQLVDIYIQHSILMFTNLPNQSAQHSVQNPPKKQKFYDALPLNFQRKEAVEIGAKYGIKTRSVDYCLEKWEGKLIQKLDVGVYVKVMEVS
jgi:hypothetical protein